MICAWKELLSILPLWLREQVDSVRAEGLQELRLRINAPPELACSHGTKWLKRKILREDLHFCVNTASRYSPWTAASSAYGYITAQGGHRIGLCGEVICKEGQITGIREITSLCIRVARDFHGIASNVPRNGSILILGAPGSGKTTLLRDLIRVISNGGEHISVVDERMELFPERIFDAGSRTDVLSGCPKGRGIDTVLRTMGPAWIAMDEITEASDCTALLHAGWCGVKLVATAHAGTFEDYRHRPVYRPLVEAGIFETVLLLRPDKSWRIERRNQ